MFREKKKEKKEKPKTKQKKNNRTQEGQQQVSYTLKLYRNQNDGKLHKQREKVSDDVT